jgi:hypothetical protein
MSPQKNRIVLREIPSNDSFATQSRTADVETTAAEWNMDRLKVLEMSRISVNRDDKQLWTSVFSFAR